MSTEALTAEDHLPREAAQACDSSFAGNSANLDLIRAAAVLCVLFGHLRYLHHAGILTAWHFAQLGVCTFFVHTSMVLMLSLARAERRGESLFGDFYIRRLFRLLPLSTLCISFVFLFVSPDTEPYRWSWKEYLANLTLTMNLAYLRTMLSVTWTLALELQMYIVLPLLFLFGRKWPLRGLLALWLVTVGMGALQPHVSGRLTVLHYAPCFIAGVIAWRLSLEAPRRLPGWAWPIAFLLVWPVFLLADQPHDLYFRAAYSLALGLAIPWFAEMRLGPLNKAVHLVARYSYGIYLTHTLLIPFAFTRPLPFLEQLALLAASLLIVPVLLYHLIEHPMVKLGLRLTAHGRKAREPRSETAW